MRVREHTEEMEAAILAALRRSPDPATLDDIKIHLDTSCPDSVLVTAIARMAAEGLVTIHEDRQHYSLGQRD